MVDRGHEPVVGATCWCCGNAADYRDSLDVHWCWPCKFADPDCDGPCNG